MKDYNGGRYRNCWNPKTKFETATVIAQGAYAM